MIRIFEFQSLLYWNLHFNEVADLTFFDLETKFQSLLYWNLHFNMQERSDKAGVE